MRVWNGLTDLPYYLKRHGYNALDAAITLEVAEDGLLPQLEADPNKLRHYNFEMAQQAPAFAMMMRGIKVDEDAREKAVEAQEEVEREAVAALTGLVPPEALPLTAQPAKCEHTKNGAHSWKGEAVCQRCGLPREVPGDFNPHSPPQVAHLFYDVLGLPPEHNHKTHKVSTDDECMERLARKYPDEASTLVDGVLEARGARKQLGLLRSPVDADGRWRTSFNVGAAVSGRWSSSDSAYGTGGNIQNIADRSRNIFVPDPELVMFYADYEKAESNVVAYDAEDTAYIAAHEAGDVHTYVARLVWPEVRDWSGDIKADRLLADLPAPWDAHHELRWYGKHVAHGTAIGMTEHGIARDARIKVKQAREARNKFRAAFPRVFARQDEIWQSVLETRTITNPLGRRRHFRGRIYGQGADATRREALAQIQQSTIVDVVGIGLARAWMELDGQASTPKPSDPCRVWLLAQVHDAILGLVRPDDDEALEALQRLMTFPLYIRGRALVIPVEIQIGSSWRHSDLVKWSPGMSWPNMERVQ